MGTEKKRSTDLLLRGIELSIAEEWLKTAELEKKHPAVISLQKELISASREAIEAQKRRENNRQVRSRQTGAVVLLIAIGATGYTVMQRQITETQRI